MDRLVWKGCGPPRFSAHVAVLCVALQAPIFSQTPAIRAEPEPEKRKINLLLLDSLPLPPAQLSKVREVTGIIREQNSEKILEYVGRGISRSLNSRSRSGKYDPLFGFAFEPVAGKPPPIRAAGANLKSGGKDPAIEFGYSVDFILSKENSPAINDWAFTLIRSGLLEVGIKSRMNVETSLMAEVDFRTRAITVPVSASGAGTFTGYLFGLPVGHGIFSGNYQSEVSVAKQAYLKAKDHSFFMAGFSVFGAGFFCSWGSQDREMNLSVAANPFSGSIKSEIEKELFDVIKAYVRNSYSPSRNEFGFGMKFIVWKGGSIEAGPEFIRNEAEPDRMFLITLRSSI